MSRRRPLANALCALLAAWPVESARHVVPELRRDEELRARAAALPGDVARLVLELAPFRYQLASCSECTSVSLWLPNGFRRELHGHIGVVHGFRFFPHGDRALSWSADRSAIIWDLASLAPVHTLRHSRSVVCGRIFPDGDRVLTCTDRGAGVIWDARSGRLVASTPEAPSAFPVTYPAVVNMGAEVLPTGDRVMIWFATVETPHIWRAAAGESHCRLTGHFYGVLTATAFPGGERVITGSRDATAIIWDALSCQALHVIPAAQPVTQVAILAQGRQVAVFAANRELRLWDAWSGQFLRSVVEAELRVLDFVRRLWVLPRALGFATMISGTAVIWNATTGAPRTLARPQRFVQNLAVAPGGDLVGSCGEGEVIVWDTASWRPAVTLLEIAADVPFDETPNICVVEFGLAPVLASAGFGRGFPARELS